MPIVKTIKIHGASTKGVSKYIKNKEKTTIKDFDKSIIQKEIDYTTNPEKTTRKVQEEKEVLVSGFRCNPNTADLEFKMLEENYHRHRREHLREGAQAITAFHMIQSFDYRDNVDPQLAHQIGLEFISQLVHYPALVSTHIDKRHIHNHILFSAYSADEISKFNHSMEQLKENMRITNELAQKYGLSIILQPEGRGTSYKEWKEIKEGNSWKEQIRIDINNTKAVTKNWNEYKEYMEAAGYKLEERGKSITYTSPTNKKVRDRKLGPDYTKEALEKSWSDKEISKSIPKEIKEDRKIEIITPKKDTKIRVSRYTSSGRRRTDLEIIFILAIKIIQKLAELFQDKEKSIVYPDNPVFKSVDWKLEQMMESLKICQNYGFEEPNQLKTKLNEVGIQLSISKKAVKEAETIADNLVEYREAIKIVNTHRDFVDSLGVNLYIKEPTEREIKKNLAAINPLSPEDKRKLHQLITKNPFYKLDYSFEEINKTEGQRIMDFLEGKIEEKPESLITINEFEEKRLIKKYEKIDSDRNKKLKETQTEMVNDNSIDYINSILIKNGKEPVKELSRYDFNKIINYYEGKNPFKGEKITEKQKEIIINLLNGQKTNRPDESMTKNEAIQVISYLKGTNKNIPELLKDFEPITPSLKNSIQELLFIKNEEIDIPIESLSRTEANKLYSYLISKDIEPDFFKEKETDNKVKFESNLLDYNLKTGEILSEYRAALELLNNAGIDEETMDEFLEFCEAKEEALEEYREKETELAAEYKLLNRLAYNLELAQNPQFTYGPKYKEQSKDAEIIEEKNNEEAKKEEEIDRGINKKEGKGYSKEDNYFNNIMR